MSTDERVWHKIFLLLVKMARRSWQCIKFSASTFAYICCMFVEVEMFIYCNPKQFLSSSFFKSNKGKKKKEKNIIYRSMHLRTTVTDQHSHSNRNMIVLCIKGYQIKWSIQRCIQNLVKHLRSSFLAKIVDGFYPLTIFAKDFILYVWQSTKYSSVIKGCNQ